MEDPETKQAYNRLISHREYEKNFMDKLNKNGNKYLFERLLIFIYRSFSR